MGRVHRYIVYGDCIESGFCLTTLGPALAGVPVAGTGREPIALDLADGGLFAAHRRRTACAGDWLRHAVLADGSVYLSDDDVFETIVSPDGRRIVCAKRGDVDDRSFEASVLNFALSTSLTLRGEEPLHATVVEWGGQAVGLLGSSGAGKSTLAAYLVAQGADLVTDDMLRITVDGDQAMAHAGPHRLKLFDEPARFLLPSAAAQGQFSSLSGKVLIQPHGAASREPAPRPLVALFSLAPGEAVATRRLGGAELIKTLIASAMDIRYDTPERLARQLRLAERTACLVPVYEISYRRTYDVLAIVADEIERTVRA